MAGGVFIMESIPLLQILPSAVVSSVFLMSTETRRCVQRLETNHNAVLVLGKVTHVTSYTNFFFFMARRPSWNKASPFLRFRDHTRAQAVGLLWTSDRLVQNTST